MQKKIILIKILLLVPLIFVLLLEGVSEAKMRSLSSVELTLQKEPEVGGIAILKLSMTAPENLDLEKASIGCFIPLDLRLIDVIDDKGNNVNYEISKDISNEALERWGNPVIFYSGPMKKGEKKEFIFKARIPDERKYRISAYGEDEEVEIDLGDPEPPEWSPQDKEPAGVMDGKHYILTRGIKQQEAGKIVDLKIPADSLPPIRTELKIRTKDRPEIQAPPYPSPIPFRYLLYTEKDSPQAEVNCILPQGLEIVDASNYKISFDPEGNTKVLLYAGSMRFKECKAFYFQVKVKEGMLRNEAEHTIRTETSLLTLQNERFSKTDTQTIFLGRVLY